MTSRSTCGWIRRPDPRLPKPSRVDERTLADLIYEFGEERHSRRIARAIVAARGQSPIQTTGQLADIRAARDSAQGGTCESIRRRGRFRRSHLGHRELEGLDAFLGEGGTTVAVNGRMP